MLANECSLGEAVATYGDTLLQEVCNEFSLQNPRKRCFRCSGQRMLVGRACSNVWRYVATRSLQRIFVAEPSKTLFSHAGQRILVGGAVATYGDTLLQAFATNFRCRTLENAVFACWPTNARWGSCSNVWRYVATRSCNEFSLQNLRKRCFRCSGQRILVGRAVATYGDTLLQEFATKTRCRTLENAVFDAWPTNARWGGL